MLSMPPSTVVVRPNSAMGGARSRAGAISRWHSGKDAIVAASRLNKPDTATLVKVEPRPVGKVGSAGSQIVARPPSATVNAAEAARHGAIASRAAKMGDANSLSQMLGARPSAATWADENEVTPLMLASAYGHMSCVEILCNAGAGLDRSNVWGSTPLINAAHNGQSGAVRLLILNGASTQLRDKDGTALDNALKRMARLVRGVNAATDKDHADKPALNAATSSLGTLASGASRGPQFKAQLQAALSPLRAMLDAAVAAAAAAEGGGGTEPKKNEGKDPDADPPDPARLASYKGCLEYAKVLQMLIEPSSVREAERRATGHTPAGSGGGDGGGVAPDGLTQRVGRIRSALALDVAISLPEAVRQANAQMGVESEGSLPDQVARLIAALGLQ